MLVSIGFQSTTNPQITSSIPGGTHSELFRMLSPTAKYFLVRSNLQKFFSQKSHKSVLASSRLGIHRSMQNNSRTLQHPLDPSLVSVSNDNGRAVTWTVTSCYRLAWCHVGGCRQYSWRHTLTVVTRHNAAAPSFCFAHYKQHEHAGLLAIQSTDRWGGGGGGD